MNYFELFDLPVSLSIDQNILTKKYIALQKKYHPDFFTLATDIEKKEALEKSALLNKAVNVLKNEVEIIKYVLQLKGVLEDDEKYQLDPGFLMEMMDLNEDVANGDKKISEKISFIAKSLFQVIKPVILNYDHKKVNPQELKELKEYYYKKKYLQRILDKINS